MKLICKIKNKLRQILKYIVYSPQFKKYDQSCSIIKPMLITPKCISLGKRVSIRNNARIEGIFERYGISYQPNIIIHDFVQIEQNCHITCAQSIEIGCNTSIAGNVTITDIHHPYDDINMSIESQKLVVKPVKIGSDCKIYNNAVILQGVQIGKHVTIAANSVVTKSIPDFCVVAGIPGRIIKRYDFELNSWRKTDMDGNFLLN